MKATLDLLVEALREELQQYGETLAVLDIQLGTKKRALAEKALSAAVIRSQTAAIRAAQSYRQLCVQHLARAFKEVEEATFDQLLERLPRRPRALIQALVDENNKLLHTIVCRVRRYWNVIESSRSGKPAVWHWAPSQQA